MSQLHKRLPLQLVLFAGVPFLACQEPSVKSGSQAKRAPKESKMQLPPSQIIPETVGATSAPFELGLTTAHIEIPIHGPSGPALLSRGSVARRVFLRIENLVSETDAPSYDVYINLPAGADPKKHPELNVGFTPTFGLFEASRGDGRHPGDGLGTQMEVTALLLRLTAAREWDGKTLRVTFVPELPWDAPAKLKVGRVSLVIG